MHTTPYDYHCAENKYTSSEAAKRCEEILMREKFVERFA